MQAARFRVLVVGLLAWEPKGLAWPRSPRLRMAAPSGSGPLDRREVVAAAGGGLAASLAWAAAPQPSRSQTVLGEGLVWRPKKELAEQLSADRSGAISKTYPKTFVAYLARFLLNFDGACRSLWQRQAMELPMQDDAAAVARGRVAQFAQFAEAVELDLYEYADGPGGVTRLFDLMRARYASPVAALEVKRQLVLLFSLLPRDQPVAGMRDLLGVMDDLCVDTVAVSYRGAGYDGEAAPPRVRAPASDARSGADATFEATLGPTGRLRGLRITDGGSGYSPGQPPEVTIGAPWGETGARTATAVAVVGDNGAIESLAVLDPGFGYSPEGAVQVTIAAPPPARAPVATATPVRGRQAAPPPPPSPPPRTAEGIALLDYEVKGVNIKASGGGYAFTTVASRLSSSWAVLDCPQECEGYTPPSDSLMVPNPEDRAAVDVVFGSASLSGGEVAAGLRAHRYATSGTELPTEQGGLPRVALQPSGAYRFLKSDSATASLVALLPQDTPLLAGPALGQVFPEGAVPSFTGAMPDPRLDGSAPAQGGKAPAGPAFVVAAAVDDAVDVVSAFSNGRAGRALLGSAASASQLGAGTWMDSVTRSSNAVFGPVASKPLEKDLSFTMSSYTRLAAAGSVCQIVSRGTLTPLELVKSRLQAAPKPAAAVPVLAGGSPGRAVGLGTPQPAPSPGLLSELKQLFQQCLRKRSLQPAYVGYLPTVAGGVMNGIFGLAVNEALRQFLVGVAADNQGLSNVNDLPYSSTIGVVIASAIVASTLNSLFLTPLEAVRVAVQTKGVKEGGLEECVTPTIPDAIQEIRSRDPDRGVGIFFDGFSNMLLREVPFVVGKFLAFEAVSSTAYSFTPGAKEDVALSLLVTLGSGIVSGIVGSVLSNPADVLLTKRASPNEGDEDLALSDVAKKLLEEDGPQVFLKGLGVRCVYFAVLIAGQFFLYDLFKVAFGVSANDMKVVLDVFSERLSMPMMLGPE